MKVNVQGSGSTSYTESNATIGSLIFSITSTTIADVTVAILESINITAQLYRGGETTTILSGNLFAIGIANNPSSYEGLAIGDYKSFTVTFGGGVVNLQDGDELLVNVSVGSSAAGQTLSMSSEYAIGIEYFTPIVNVYPIDKTRTAASLSLGNNVSCASVVHTAADLVIIGANINSSIWKANYGVTEFYGKMAEQWERVPDNYSFHLFNDAVQDGVQCDLIIDTTATGNAYLVSYAGRVTPVVQRRSAKLEERIARTVTSKFAPHKNM